MITPHDYFSRLGLNPGATSADVRRAYARELKKIDQASDAGGFQELREAYEWALRYVQLAELNEAQHGAAEAQAGAAPPASSATPTAPPPEQSAQAAFRHFSDASARLAASGPEQEPSAWVALLRQHLAGEPLQHLAARAAFEARIAATLTHWRAGNEALFAAAQKVFDWRDDRRSLRQLGAAGALIEQAIDEQAMFATVSGGEYEAQVKVAARLRDPREPTREEFRRDRFHIERMVLRYPAMMALIVDARRLEYWRRGYRDMPGMPRQSRPGAGAAGPPAWPASDDAWRAAWPALTKSSKLDNWVLVISLLSGVVQLLFFLNILPF